MPIYTITDQAGVSDSWELESIEEAEIEAAEWLREGLWDLSGGTIWVDATIRGGGETSSVTVRIDPEEPDCAAHDSEHDWRQIAAGNSAGRVFTVEQCDCGARRITDSHAVRPDTGQVMGRSVRYEINGEPHPARPW